MEGLITVFDWRCQWLTVVCSISSIIWAEDTNWRPGGVGFNRHRLVFAARLVLESNVGAGDAA